MNDRVDEWMLLMDPAWRQAEENEAPPLTAVVGLWPLGPQGSVGKFRSNPDYRPTDESSPSDPLDAVFRQLVRGSGEIEPVQGMLRDILLDVAMNGDGHPLILPSPDGIACVIVASSARYRALRAAWDWRRVDLSQLVGLLTDGVDVLFNPGGPASLRLTADFLRSTAAMSAEEAARLWSNTGDLDNIKVSTWQGFAP